MGTTIHLTVRYSWRWRAAATKIHKYPFGNGVQLIWWVFEFCIETEPA